MQEFKIKALGRHGDGIADGPIFVPRTLPGEVVSGVQQGEALDGARIVTPSSDRVKPPCRHFKTCGGCTLQHASDSFVAAWKQETVVLALQAQGLTARVRDIQTSPTHSRRRARFSARRTKSGATAGFHGRATDTVIDIEDCPLITAELALGLPLARALAREAGSRKGEIGVQCTVVQDGLDVSVSGGKPLDEALHKILPQIAIKFGVVRLTYDEELVAQAAPARHRIGRADVMIPAGAFLQATSHGEAILQTCVQQATQGAHAVADLFAGCGTFSLLLAERGPVLAVEGDKAMARALQEAANHAQIGYPIKAQTRDLFEDPLSADELSKFDAVVLDPPRAGALAQARMLADSQVPQIGYVSCDAQSFARDAKVLTDGGYILDWVQAVDQFRWSTHVELAARLYRP